MSEPKRHHFISQMQLRRFTTANGKLFFSDKSRPEKGVLAGTPRDLFVKNHLYSLIAKDGTRNTSLEKQFSKLENRAHPIIGKIITAAQKGRLAGLSQSEKETWDEFYYLQWSRVPDVHQNVLSDFHEIFALSTKRFERELRPLTSEERMALEDPKVLARIERNARVKALGNAEGEALDLVRARGIRVGVIVVPNAELVIGSNPVVTLRKADGIPENAAGVWLPITPTVAVSLAASQTDELHRWPEGGSVQKINEATFRQSTVVAGRSRSLIASIAGLR
jgi:hypothetical protein